MSAAQSLDLRGVTGDGSRGQTDRATFSAEFIKRLTTTSTPRFGALSHHSFFSRHNPHPNRVRHIQGLNGRPVCSVRDDWCVTSSLFPHPLLRSHVFRKAAAPSVAIPLPKNMLLFSSNKNKSALYSEAWRDELKDLAAKVTSSSPTEKDKRADQPGEELIRRKTQYSAETGRIIPPSSKSYKRRSLAQRMLYTQPLLDQELMVFELLCQILQTDSLSSVQQWLLLAGQREKDLVMGMIKQALDGVDFSGQHHLGVSPLPSLDQSRRKPQRTSSHRANRAFSDDIPERIGDAEVLEVHTGAHSYHEEEAVEHTKGL